MGNCKVHRLIKLRQNALLRLGGGQQLTELAMLVLREGSREAAFVAYASLL
jgi:hypothetical protein